MKVSNRCRGEAKARQPPKGEWFCMWRLQTNALSLSFLTDSSAVLKATHSYVQLQEGLLCPPAQSQEREGDTRRVVCSLLYHVHMALCISFNACALCNTFELCSRNTVNIYLPTYLVFYLCFIQVFFIVKHFMMSDLERKTHF